MVARRKTAKRGVACPKGKVRVCFCTKPKRKTTTRRRATTKRRLPARSTKRKASYKRPAADIAIYDYY